MEREILHNNYILGRGVTNCPLLPLANLFQNGVKRQVLESTMEKKIKYTQIAQTYVYIQNSILGMEPIERP